MDFLVPKIIQRDASELQGTRPWFRKVEIISSFVYPCALAAYAHHAFPGMRAWPLLVPPAWAAGAMISDFISGFFHWLFDTWGTPDTFIVGKIFIRTFREHHVDQKSIARHDFIETNGTNILSGIALGSVCLAVHDSGASKTDAFIAEAFVFGSIYMALTSQIHKWAHMDRPPRAAAWLQRWRLILSPEHHAVHHVAPFLRSYCITTGWLNHPLATVRFFSILERAITLFTGALPRKDDIGTAAAIETMPEPILPPSITSCDVANGDAHVVLAAARKGVIDEDLT